MDGSHIRFCTGHIGIFYFRSNANAQLCNDYGVHYHTVFRTFELLADQPIPPSKTFVLRKNPKGIVDSRIDLSFWIPRCICMVEVVLLA